MTPITPNSLDSNRLRLRDKATRKKEDSIHSSEAIISSPPKELSFLEMVEQIAPYEKERTKDIHILWKELPQLERELIQTRSNESLEKYKAQIKALLHAILEKNTRYKKSYTPIPGTHQKKEYTYIEYIDEKLKLLAEVIHHPQNTAFQILKQMDNIRGFLLDLER